MSAGGLDTVSLAWRGQGGSQLLSRVLAAPSFRSGRGVTLSERSPSGLRVMAWPDHGLVAAEGRLGPVLDQDSRSWRLPRAAELEHAEEGYRREIRALLGVEPEDSDPEVRRYDLTAEREFDRPADGFAFLRAVGALCPAGYKLKKFDGPGNVPESRYVVTPRRARPVFRAYDKNRESAQGEPGLRVRLEAQLRPPKAQRRRPAVLASRDLRSDFGRTLAPFLQGSDVTVTHSTGLVDQLAQRLARGELTAARAERLLGAALLLEKYGRAVYASDHQSARRLRALRDAGLALDDELPREATMPVSALLREMVEEFAP